MEIKTWCLKLNETRHFLSKKSIRLVRNRVVSTDGKIKKCEGGIILTELYYLGILEKGEHKNLK